MSRAHFRKLPALVAAVLAAGLFTACGVEDIDRTQPNKVKKDLFEGEWFYRQTVIDVPATANLGFTFIGEQGGTERIAWEIQENFLFAYRAYPFQPGGDGHVRPGTGPYLDNPVAAFKIESHFDVIRQYNPQTGEQTNVLIEDTQDRPWFEREYMRVDWSKNQIAEFSFSAGIVDQQPVNSEIPQDDDPSRVSKDQAKIGPDYIDVVTRVAAKPAVNQLYSDYFGMTVLECWLYTNIHQDCGSAEIRIRSSFMKAPPAEQASTYMPLKYDDIRFQRFGYFRAERYSYNPEYGIVEPGNEFYAARFNLWDNAASCYDPEADLPYASCSPDQLRTIVYYLNEDFPEEYKEGAIDNGREWNRVFREGVMAGTGWTAEQLGNKNLFVICPNNPVQKGDPAECGYNEDPALNPNPQIGDLRYSMYYYVPNPQETSPLGYGPSAQDPLTGETISANAFYYGAPGKWIAARTRDIIKYELGLLDEEDITGGMPARSAVMAARASVENRRREFAERYSPERIRQSAERLNIRETGLRLRHQIRTGEAFLDKRAARLAALDRTGLDEMLMTQDLTEVVRAFGAEREGAGGTLDYIGIRDMKKLLDPELFDLAKTKHARLLSPKAGGCILMAEDVFDAGLVGLTALVRRTFYDTTVNPPALKTNPETGEPFTEKDVYDFIVMRTMMDTQLHEIGHTVGLRHNFSGSTDALNFGPKYWELRGYMKGQNDPRPAKLYELSGAYQQAYELALSNGMLDLQDSSVMDYASTYGTNTELGLYDAAAIKYAYFDVVEVFNSPDITRERAQLLRQGELHYTYYPEVVSDASSYEERVAAMYDRSHVNWRKTDNREALYDDELIEVPYSFCSDEYREGSAVCYTWDSGVDNWERTSKMMDDYRNYLLFDAYKRERVGFGVDVFEYLSRLYTRKFAYMLFQYKNWVNDELIIRSDRPCVWYENGQRREVADRFVEPACGEAGYIAAVETANLFAEVMQTPDIGCYVRLQPGCYETDANNDTGVTIGASVVRIDEDPAVCDTYWPAPNEDNPVRALKVTATSPWYHVPDSTSCDGWEDVIDTAEAATVCSVSACADGGSCACAADADCVAVNPDDAEDDTGFCQLVLSEPERELEYGEARQAISLYDRQKYGYYFYWKPVVMGSWWDKWMAVKALGDSYTDFIGVDASSDTRSFLINLNTLFSAELNDVIAGIATENVSQYGPQFDANGNVVYPPLIPIYQGDGRNPSLAPIDPDQQYTFRLLAMFNSAYQSQYTDDLEFQETLRIERDEEISDDDVPADVRNDPTRFASLYDPETGYTYWAIRRDRLKNDDTPIYSTGYEFIREIKDRYYVGGRDGPGLELREGFYDWQPQSDIRILEIMLSTDRVFGNIDVWSGDPGF